MIDYTPKRIDINGARYHALELLASGEALSRALVSRARDDMRSGEVFLPDTMPVTALPSLASACDDLSRQASLQALARRLVHGHKDSGTMILLEDSESRHGDSWLADAESTVMYDRDGAVYHMPRSVTFDGVVGAVVAAESSWRLTGVVSNVVLAPVETITSERLQQVAAGATELLFSAFDGNGYLLCTLSYIDRLMSD